MKVGMCFFLFTIQQYRKKIFGDYPFYGIAVGLWAMSVDTCKLWLTTGIALMITYLAMLYTGTSMSVPVHSIRASESQEKSAKHETKLFYTMNLPRRTSTCLCELSVKPTPKYVAYKKWGFVEKVKYQ